jgi:outer membrane protein OmpA-like peptidoglycan-associated protein
MAAANPTSVVRKSATLPQLVYELPAVAHIDAFEIDAFDSTDPATKIHFEISSTDPKTFTDAGTIALAGTSAGAKPSPTLTGPFTARWVRVTIDMKPGASLYVSSISAIGTVTVPRTPFAGRWAMAYWPAAIGDRIFEGTTTGATLVPGKPIGNGEAATFEYDGGVLGGSCNRDYGPWRGPIVDGRAMLGGADALQVVANGALLVGEVGGYPIVAQRIKAAPTCDVAPRGNGPEVVMIKRNPTTRTSESDPKVVAGHRFTTVFLFGLRAEDLAHAHAAMLAYDCKADDDLSTDQQKLLLAFVASGHVLMIRDADDCTHSTYGFMPYAFTSQNSGASGARGTVLKVADSSALGSVDPHDRAHFFDARAYLADTNQQIGDSDIMKTDDAHWCGLLFAKNLKGASGWVHAYARFGRGVITFTGFDTDDLDHRVVPAMKLAKLDYDYSPSTPLPCTAKVALDPLGPPKPALAPAPPPPKKSIATQLEHGGRARIYGIHFDVASARIQPRSEGTIAEIARVLEAHGNWRMRVEGHTDSDGDAASNLTLSIARAKSVVADLRKHGIATSRLVAAGYGSTRPVATNATDAGKALNRRVELVRL